MKLLSLAMTAFGPYAATEVIDFHALGDRSFFLICGPTGAGKSSILDGICFALYGETSGRDRDPGRMRSDFADDRTETGVTLEFALRDRIYRVTRRPKQQRRALRGAERMVEMPAKAQLERLDSDGTTLEVLAEAVREVDERIAELMGFDAEQFRQIVMLPQGKFQRLLLCPSGDREKILEVLFGTAFFRRIQDRLREDCARLRRTWEDGDTRRQTMLEQAGIENLAALEQGLAALGQKADGLAAAMIGLREALRLQQEELQRARQVIEKLDELEAAKSRLEALAGRDADVALKRETLRAAQAALGLADMETFTLQKEADAAAAQKNLEKTEAANAKAEDTAAVASSALSVETEREPKRKALEDQLKDLAAAAPRFDALEKARADFEHADRDWRRMADEQDNLDREVMARQRAITADAEEVEKCREESADIRYLTAETDRLERLLEERAQLDRARKSLRNALKKASEATDAAEAADRRLESARKKVEQLETRWVTGQASRLAATLADGVPCPVCGSAEHPAPAKISAPTVTDSELDEARLGLQQLDTDVRAVQKAVVAAERDVELLKTRIEGFETTLADYAVRPLSELQSEVRQSRERCEAAQQAAGRLAQLQESLRVARETLVELEAAVRKAGKSTDELRQRRTQAETQVIERMKSLPEGIGDRRTLEQQVSVAEGQLALLQGALDKARKEDAAAQKALVEAQTALRGQRELMERVLKEKAEAEAQFALRVREAGFGSVDAYTASRRDANTVEELEAEIREFDTSCAKAKGLLDRALEAASGLERPEPAVVQSKIDATRRDLDAAIADERSTRDRVNSLTRLRSDVVALVEELAQAEARYNVTSRLSELARGRNSRRITLQQFVLTTILDGVLQTANRRYGPMTRGRYQLLRVDAENEGKGGLDLAVLDSHTNQPRLASTLSGGEVFQASLALALGLADEVMANAGGIQLDTTFVDEGFGSLDSESLDLAVRWLMDLQETGRTVGIISHVPELRERIETRLEVIPSPTGSRTEFVV